MSRIHDEAVANNTANYQPSPPEMATCESCGRGFDSDADNWLDGECGVVHCICDRCLNLGWPFK